MPSPPTSPVSPVVTEGGRPNEDTAESGLSDQQQAAMQQEEKVLSQQIENLQKEKSVSLPHSISFALCLSLSGISLQIVPLYSLEVCLYCRSFVSNISLFLTIREELTFEMLALEPRTSDDELLESEASIGTADSSENLIAEQEGATSEAWGNSTAIQLSCCYCA